MLWSRLGRDLGRARPEHGTTEWPGWEWMGRGRGCLSASQMRLCFGQEVRPGLFGLLVISCEGILP